MEFEFVGRNLQLFLVEAVLGRMRVMETDRCRKGNYLTQLQRQRLPLRRREKTSSNSYLGDYTILIQSVVNVVLCYTFQSNQSCTTPEVELGFYFLTPVAKTLTLTL